MNDDKAAAPQTEIQALRNRLADALESGGYEQGRHYLREGDCFCVMGVLCDIYAKDHPGAKWEERTAPGTWKFTFPDSGAAQHAFSYPPTQAAKWLGVSLATVEDLAALNDMGISFSELAQVIRALPDTGPIEALIRQCEEEE